MNGEYNYIASGAKWQPATLAINFTGFDVVCTSTSRGDIMSCFAISSSHLEPLRKVKSYILYQKGLRLYIFISKIGFSL